MSPEHAMVAAMLLCGLGALLTGWVASRRTLAGWIAFGCVAGSSLLTFHAVARVLLYGPGKAFTFLTVPQMGFALRLYVDGLSAIFLGLIATVALPAALYSIAYLDHYRAYSVRRYYPNFLLFIAAMYGLVSTTDMMYFFFIFWQMMTLTGYALIRYEHDKPENLRAANKYLAMMQIACAATMIGAGMLAAKGVTGAVNSAHLIYDFDTVSEHLPLLLREHPIQVAVAFALFLVGFGIKLGTWPFGQIWLPDAHPAAPSPVSALLSGVMIKTGVYGLMRYFLWLVPPEAKADYPMAMWGAIIAVLGTITLFVGTTQALRQHQTKRLLAFSSIGQGGYILLGLGACLCLLASSDARLTNLAAFGLYGALFHTINHGLFKSLLFLNAGSILHATGTQDMNKLGGLMKHMPFTAITALIGSLSIAGVPLFNGFASKWCIYVATLQADGAARFLPICAVVAIFTSAITLALFMKFFGVSFLSRTSSLVAAQAARQPSLEVGWMMRLPQWVLATLCVGLGLFPMVALSIIHHALQASQQGFGTVLAKSTPVTWGLWRGAQGLGGNAVLAPVALVMVVGLLIVLARALTKLGGAQRRQTVPWLCGYARETYQNRYHADHFYGALKRYFHWLGGAPAKPQRPAPVAQPPSTPVNSP